MKKIAFFNIPAYGHINPTLQVVKQLTDMGHSVYYFSYMQFKEDVEKAGGLFISCDKYLDYIDAPADMGDRLAKDIAFSTKIIVDCTLSMDRFILEKLKEIQPDVVVYDSVAYWGRLAAIKLGIPCISSTTTFAYNKHSAQGMQGGIMDLLRLVFQLIKSKKHIKRLNRQGYKVKNIFDIIANSNDTPTVVYTSRLFQPYSETFGENYSFVGPLIKDSQTVTAKSDRPLIYISMGTVNNNMLEFFNRCIEAFDNSQYDVIISTGSRIDKSKLLPHSENIKIHTYTDQISLLKNADVFLTHCGMNSVNEALYFAVPLVMYPQTKEQTAVAKRAQELGCGVMVDDISQIKSQCQLLLDDKSFKDNASRISASFQACGGAFQAAQAILKTAK